MIDNHLYNLMNQLVQESKSLKRINEDYKKDAGECSDCHAFWDKMIQEKEQLIKELTDSIKNHLQK